ncbi:MAG: DotA/TraY family protein [Rhodospirillales bacterium]|nr:DotA/TraY family protein [Rhodospirillales bacterium]MCB9996143.1 DotA/TraY family protein [Rhodospirillales bacterium]
MANEQTKKILRFTLTPQILPRVQGLFGSGFSYIAYYMAQIYQAARLLPPGHPYLYAGNIGRFGIRHVVAEAGRNLVFKKENLDQIVIYVMVLLGLVLLAVQTFMLCMALVAQSAHAGTLGPVPDTFASYFLLANGQATHDLAFVLLDRVFGVPNFFVDVGGGQTCVATGATCFDIGKSTSTTGLVADTTLHTQLNVLGDVPGTSQRITVQNIVWPFPFHEALHKIIEAYSIGLLLIAVFIFLYFIAAVVAETAQSGTPFGRRFNHVWAPLRIVAAMGMLVPLTHGFNSAQYILLYAAKWGSGFATNGWVLFNNSAVSTGDALLGNQSTLVAEPNAPPVNTLIEFFTIVSTCKKAYEIMYHQRVDRAPIQINAWLVNPRQPGLAPLALTPTDFPTAVTFFNRSDIVIRFGEDRGAEHQTREGRVVPYCGELQLQLTDLDDIGSPGSYEILEEYYNLVRTEYWSSAANAFAGPSCAYTGDPLNDIGCIGHNVTRRYLPYHNNPNAPLPDAQTLEDIRWVFQNRTESIIQSAVATQKTSPEWMEQVTEIGWGGAAIWYNKVAQLNGTLIGAAYSVPVIRKYPDVMEKIRQNKAGADTDTKADARHARYKGPDASMRLGDEEEDTIANALYQTQRIWDDQYSDKKQSGNIYLDIINMIFGTSGLFDMQKNADDNIHPLAQLTAIGRSVVETAIRNLGFSAASGLAGGLANVFGVHGVGKLGMAASSFATQIGMLGMSIGFVLFYVIPFLPFIYFFFAVGGWIKAIFEAMVGVPLWALAHIRIDGNGLPGDAAMGGYYLILEIFLRPILIVFGFLASVTIFGAQVKILHEIWPLVTSNVTGFDQETMAAYNANQPGGTRFLRGAIDKFFFTVIYAIVVYMLGMSAFKMIDLVPNHVLRWIGASVSTFGDQSGDPAQNLVRNSYIGSSTLSGQLSSGINSAKGAAQGSGQALQELAGRAK